MIIRAKFYVSNLVAGEGSTASQVSMHPVCRGVENSLWAQATPSGSIMMNVKNDGAFEQFEQGAEYEVTFRKVAKPTPGDGHAVVRAVNMYGGIVCETCGAQLGFTDEAVERQPYLASSNTPEVREEALARHEATFGSR